MEYWGLGGQVRISNKLNPRKAPGQNHSQTTLKRWKLSPLDYSLSCLNAPSPSTACWISDISINYLANDWFLLCPGEIYWMDGLIKSDKNLPKDIRSWLEGQLWMFVASRQALGMWFHDLYIRQGYQQGKVLVLHQLFHELQSFLLWCFCLQPIRQCKRFIISHT